MGGYKIIILLATMLAVFVLYTNYTIIPTVSNSSQAPSHHKSKRRKAAKGVLLHLPDWSGLEAGE